MRVKQGFLMGANFCQHSLLVHLNLTAMSEKRRSTAWASWERLDQTSTRLPINSILKAVDLNSAEIEMMKDLKLIVGKAVLEILAALK